MLRKKGYTLPQLLLTVLCINAMLAWMFLAAGCSATREIAATASNIQRQVVQSSAVIIDEATQTQADLETIRNEDTAPVINSVQERQDRIIAAAEGSRTAVNKAVSDIHRNLTRVEDKVPWWATTIGWVAGAIGLVAVLILLWKTGVLALIGRVVGLGTALIPRSIKDDAAFDAEAITTGTATPLQRENIARKRASSRAYEAAFLEAKDGH